MLSKVVEQEVRGCDACDHVWKHPKIATPGETEAADRQKAQDEERDQSYRREVHETLKGLAESSCPEDHVAQDGEDDER
jgi:hypothetical protein